MKNVLIITNLLTAGLLAGLFINGNVFFNLKPIPECNTCTNICSDYTGKPINKLEVRMLQDISSNYKTSVIGASLTNTKIAKTDASNIWFSLDTLKRFIWNIESNTCNINCDGKKKLELGIRIYFARYPDARTMTHYTDLNNPQTKYFENCHTLFMVPTYDLYYPGKGLQHMDFDPTSKSISANCTIPPIDTLEGSTTIALMLPSPAPQPPTSVSSSTSAQNHGGLCPPLKCDPGASF
jgi:hypothetical protein